MSTLLLLTDAFPFGLSEAFLETEVGYLPSRFTGVFVVPSRVVDGPHRPVPKGVQVETGLAVHLKRASAVTSGVRAMAGIRRIIGELRNTPRAVDIPSYAPKVVAHWCRAVSIRDWLIRFIKNRAAGSQGAIVYTYWLGSGTLGAILASRQCANVCVVSRAHRFDLYEERQKPAIVPFRGTTLRGLDKLHLICEHGHQYISSRYPQWNSKYRLARLGTRDPGVLTPASMDGVLRVVSCSHLASVKRVPLLIEGIACLAQQHPKLGVEWNHVGGGTRLDELVVLAKKTLPESVSWRIHGAIANEKVIEYYQRHCVDVFVNVSRSEGLPVSIMEAMSFGIPVVATAVGGTPEIVNEENGYLLPQDCAAQQIAAAILEVAHPPTSSRRKRAREHWARFFDASRNYPRFAEDLFQTASGRSSAARPLADEARL